MLAEQGYGAECQCPMRGRRCPEIADGGLNTFFEATVEQASAEFLLLHCRRISEPQKATLALDFECGKQRLALHLRVKTDAWQVLPLKLCVVCLSSRTKRNQMISMFIQAKYKMFLSQIHV